MSREDAQGDTYQWYHPLSVTKNEIRLIELQPFDAENPHLVQCRLRHCSLDDKPIYTALSYSWGDPKQTTPIMVNDKEFHATHNLAAALSQLSKDRAQVIWIDAICINQCDDGEKSHQVQQMDKIFTLASTVVAWIGPDDSHSRRALRTIRVMHEIAQALRLQTILEPDLAAMPSKESTTLELAIIGLVAENSALEPGGIGSVMSLLSRPYFTRLWVVQEVCLAQVVDIICGSDTLPFNQFHSAMTLLHILRSSFYNGVQKRASRLNYLEEQSAQLYALYSPFDPCQGDPPALVHVSAKVQQSGPQLDIGELVMYTCEETNITVSDPRDCVYALLGLMKQEDRARITIDYEDPYVSCFLQTSHLLLEQYGPTILAFSGLCSRGPVDLAMPSWVLDLTYTSSRSQCLITSYNIQRLASPYTFAALGQQEIVLLGIPVGRVIDPVAYTGLSAADDIQPVISWAHKTYWTSGQPQPGATHWQIDLLRTLCYDQPSGQLHLTDDKVIGMLQPFVQRHLTIPPPELAPASTQFHSSDAYENILSEARKDFPAYERVLWNTEPRTIFSMGNGLIRSGPPGTLQDDVIYVVKDSMVPFVLRAVVDDRESGSQRTKWKLVGPAYVPGLILASEDFDKFWAQVHDRDVEEIIIC